MSKQWVAASYAAMNPTDAIAELRARCNELARVITAMHAPARHLGHSDAQAEVLRALFELTRQVETVKKTLLRLEKSDASTVL